MPIPTTPSATIARRLHRDEVFDLLLEAIVGGCFGDGERLHDTELEEWLGVSRTPIRMALARLEDLSLIETAPKRYTRVSHSRPWLVQPLLRTLCSLWALALDDALADDEVRRAAARALGAPGDGPDLASTAAPEPSPEEARVVPSGAPAVVEALVSTARLMTRASVNHRLPELTARIGVAISFHARSLGRDLDDERLSRAVEALGSSIGSADVEASRHALADIAASPLVRAETAAAAAAATARSDGQ